MTTVLLNSVNIQTAGFGEIIGVVAMILFSFYQTWAKAKKQREEQAKGMDEMDDDPFEGMFEPDFERNRQEDPFFEEDYEDELESEQNVVSQTSVSDIIAETDDPAKSSSSTVVKAEESPSPKGKMKRAVVRSKKKRSFNLREAVIQTEILNRKYS